MRKDYTLLYQKHSMTLYHYLSYIGKQGHRLTYVGRGPCVEGGGPGEGEGGRAPPLDPHRARRQRKRYWIRRPDQAQVLPHFNK